MAKKSNLPLYLIGMALVVIGCFLPLTASKFFGGGSSAFHADKSIDNIEFWKRKDGIFREKAVFIGNIM